jgi:cell division protein FtsQ
VAVQERQPVAIALADEGLGYLDEEGNYIPGKLYSKEIQNKLPKVPQFLGFDPQYRSFWQSHLHRIQQSPVNIRIINGNNPSNITLTTNLGVVFLGSDLSRFDQQLQTLEKMQNLPRRIPKERLAFIDLTNPDNPSVQLKPQSSSAKETVNKP